MTSLLTQGLPLFSQEHVQAEAEIQARVARLLSILEDRQWHTAKDLKVYGFTDRELRELVEHSDGQILSFPGSPGYKLFEAATIDEIKQTRALRNQARRMIVRYFRYQRRFHRGK